MLSHAEEEEVDRIAFNEQVGYSNGTFTVQLGPLGESWNGPHLLLKKFA
jgi:hypothetical protein